MAKSKTETKLIQFVYKTEWAVQFPGPDSRSLDGPSNLLDKTRPCGMDLRIIITIVVIPD